MASRIGDLIGKAEASESTAQAKAEAAIAANREASDARAVANDDKKPLARALIKTHDVTMPLPDGRYKTFSPDPNSPDGFTARISGNLDVMVPDDEAPAQAVVAGPAATNDPAPAPPGVEASGVATVS